MTNTTRATRSDLEPMSLLISSLVRRSWLILGCTAAVAAGVWFLIGATEDPVDDVTATSRVGVTTEVVWPFYDVVLEHGRVMVADPAFEAELEADLGFAVESISTSIPDLLSVFNIDVVADTADHAVAAADRAADLVVERGLAEATQDTTEGIVALDAQIAELTTRIDEIRARVDQANAQIAEIAALQAVEYDQVREEQRWTIALDRDVDQAVLIDSERDRSDRINQRAALATTVLPDPQFEVLRLAESADDKGSTACPSRSPPGSPRCSSLVLPPW